jgi:hypothetical protein
VLALGYRSVLVLSFSSAEFVLTTSIIPIFWQTVFMPFVSYLFFGLHFGLAIESVFQGRERGQTDANQSKSNDYPPPPPPAA